jgi:putative oxidoreductase
MFEQTHATEDRDRLTDWVLRGGVALVFVLFGMEKFQSRPDGSWVKFFAAVGFGQWFRYATGAIEVVGGLLVLIPKIARAGLALLAVTMACAAMIVTFRLGRPQDSIVSALFFVVLSALWWTRRNSGHPG